MLAPLRLPCEDNLCQLEVGTSDAKKGDYHGAINAFRLAIQSAESAIARPGADFPLHAFRVYFEAHYRRGSAYYLLSKPALARVDFDTVIQGPAKVIEAEAHTRLRLTNLIAQQGIAQANSAAPENGNKKLRELRDEERTLQKYKRQLDRELEKYGSLALGFIRFDEQDFGEAIHEFSRAIQEHGWKGFDGYFYRGFAYFLRGQPWKAEDDFHKARAIDPAAFNRLNPACIPRVTFSDSKFGKTQEYRAIPANA